MALSNHTIVALGILTRRAKQSVGVYKVADILENDQQAYELMTQTILSGDQALVSLTKELNKTLKIAPNIMQALENYIDYMRAEGQTESFINRHCAGLKDFTKHLYKIPNNGAAYRQAANAYLAEEEQFTHSFCLNLIRKFYPFWLDTHQALIDDETQHTFSIEKESKALLALWNKLDSTFLTTIEESALKAYMKAIKSMGIDDEQIVLRNKLVKLIMIKQRDFENTPAGYRQNIATIDDYFSQDKLLNYFLSVSREFYSIWSKTQIT